MRKLTFILWYAKAQRAAYSAKNIRLWRMSTTNRDKEINKCNNNKSKVDHWCPKKTLNISFSLSHVLLSFSVTHFIASNQFVFFVRFVLFISPHHSNDSVHLFFCTILWCHLSPLSSSVSRLLSVLININVGAVARAVILYSLLTFLMCLLFIYLCVNFFCRI